MSLIGQRVFLVGGEQKYMTLANEEFTRPLGIGSSWGSVRVGVLCAITPDGTNNLTSSNLIMGMATTGYGQAGSLWGACWYSYSGGGLTYNAGSGNPYFSSATGATTSSAGWYGTGMGSNIATNTGAVQRRSILLADVIKAAVNQFHIRPLGLTTALAQADCSFSDFIGVMEQSGPSLKGVTLSTGNYAYNYAVAGLVSSINNAFIYWSKAAFPLEVYAFAVYRYS